ncbi:flagellin, partial [Rubrimonas cliftonensis]
RAMAVQLEAYATAETGAAATTDLANISTQANITTALNTAATALFGNMTFDNASGGISVTATTGRTTELAVNGAQTGGLAELGLIDVSTKGGAAAALSAIEGMTQSSINAAASFGSSGKRVDIQMTFLKDLTDSLTAGIGSLVDADMEETSARLQALQVQQQLGVQALSIANQQPQTLLSLFR